MDKRDTSILWAAVMSSLRWRGERKMEGEDITENLKTNMLEH